MPIVITLMVLFSYYSLIELNNVSMIHIGAVTSGNNSNGSTHSRHHLKRNTTAHLESRLYWYTLNHNTHTTPTTLPIHSSIRLRSKPQHAHNTHNTTYIELYIGNIIANKSLI